MLMVYSSITSYENYYNLDSSSKVIKGWDNDSGELNFELQRMPDNFYYQNFSYSLKSSVPFETWNEPVSSLNHTLGFKKFSDYQLETTNSNSMTVGLSTALTHFSVVNDLQGFASINCFYDFDLATENNLNLNSKVVSDEIVFANRILTDYFESVGNRVLSIDDLSGQFNSNPRPTIFSVVDTFTLASTRFQKYITYVRDKRYTHRDNSCWLMLYMMVLKDILINMQELRLNMIKDHLNLVYLDLMDNFFSIQQNHRK